MEQSLDLLTSAAVASVSALDTGASQSYATLLAQDDATAAEQWQSLDDAGLDRDIDKTRQALRDVTAQLDALSAKQQGVSNAASEITQLHLLYDGRHRCAKILGSVQDRSQAAMSCQTEQTARSAA